MATTLTLTGDSIYMRLLQESDMDTIAGSLTGFREFSVAPTVKSKKHFWYTHNKENIAFPSSERAITTNDHLLLTLVVCLVSDNSVIGFNTSLIAGTTVHSEMTALVPSVRNTGKYKEIITLRHKFIFNKLQAEHSRMKIPATGSNNPVRLTLDTLYTGTDRTFTPVGMNTEFRESTIAAADWNTWVNHSDRTTQKNQNFNLTWN